MSEEMLYEKIRKMNYEELGDFSQSVRKYIYDVVYNNNGHLASNYGVVELTLAMYRVFDPIDDVIIWDTSHQAYIHKLLTGRWGAFSTLRSYGGISGFTNINESKADRFIAGHAGTSISAAFGYSYGDKLKNIERNIVAVIGDGAFSSGMALESINQLKYHNSNVKIILNSNDMSISPNVGTLSTILSKFRMKKEYIKTKEYIKDSLSESSFGQDFEDLLKKIKDGIKYSIYSQPIGFFEDLGIKYYGPVDGHNIREMEIFLQCLKEYDSGPAVLHVLTTKGKGLEKAEKNPSKFHGVGKKDERAGISFSKIVGNTLADLENEEFIAISAAMPEGTGLDILQNKFPKKFLDMGITEPSAVTSAAAIALTGTLPVVDIYSTFMQRAYDSVIHDVALQNVPVLFLLDRAGLVGEDGPTHHGVFDIAFLKNIPGVEVYAPYDGFDLASMISTFVKEGIEKPTFIRFPKEKEFCEFEDIKNNIKIVNKDWKFLKKSGSSVYFLGVGTMAKKIYNVLNAEEVNIVAVRTIKPLDRTFLDLIAESATDVFIYEEGIKDGGISESIKLKLMEKNSEIKVNITAVNDEFITHGNREKLLEICGMDEESIKNVYTNYLKKSGVK
ncbi:MAG TPA: 1-deoxy-D-xylulose-5-phosphate synthase [Tepiditoga sp.]|nr:1-deoxy-D-xylulose-5-phosphate synthase [Tepiditoga sp.]